MAVVSKPKRPSSITVLSVFGILSGLLSFWMIFQGTAQGLAETVFFALGGVIFLICGIGFWLMKKWAVYMYAVFAVIDQIVLLLLGRWNVMALLLPLIVIYIGYKHLSKMS